MQKNSNNNSWNWLACFTRHTDSVLFLVEVEQILRFIGIAIIQANEICVNIKAFCVNLEQTPMPIRNLCVCVFCCWSIHCTPYLMLFSLSQVSVCVVFVALTIVSIACTVSSYSNSTWYLQRTQTRFRNCFKSMRRKYKKWIWMTKNSMKYS